MHPFVSPKFMQRAFNCPHCGAYAEMHWEKVWMQSIGDLGLHLAQCAHCNELSCWRGMQDEDGECTGGLLVIPDSSLAPQPHPDMPMSVSTDYLEARSIVGRSPRGAAALLRLAIQKLCVELGEPGKNINSDIGELVRKGLPVEIQQALDVVRVVGNNSVHPGELSDADIGDIAFTLFELVNAIVEDRVSRPKKLAALFERLPQGARDAIAKRDTPKGV